jgi:hypothetical protein
MTEQITHTHRYIVRHMYGYIEDIDYSSITGKRTPKMTNNVTFLSGYVTLRHFVCTCWTHRYNRLCREIKCQCLQLFRQNFTSLFNIV